MDVRPGNWFSETDLVHGYLNCPQAIISDQTGCEKHCINVISYVSFLL